MSRKRSLVADALAAEERPITSSRDDAITRSRDDVITPPASPPRHAGVRHGYRTSLYLPREAQFKLREIALMKRCKPHDLLVEAVAELFERYNAGSLAAQIRKSRDDAITSSRE